MDRRKLLLLSTVTLGLAVAAPAMAQTETPRPGGTLRFVMKYEPPTLSSITTHSTPLTSGKIFDGLVTYDFDLKPRPQLATSWTVSPDGLKYVFKLREGVTWHDGKPFTSADAAFSILRLKQGHPRGRRHLRQCRAGQHARPPDAGAGAVEAGSVSDGGAGAFRVPHRPQASL